MPTEIELEELKVRVPRMMKTWLSKHAEDRYQRGNATTLLVNEILRGYQRKILTKRPSKKSPK